MINYKIYFAVNLDNPEIRFNLTIFCFWLKFDYSRYKKSVRFCKIEKIHGFEI